MSFEVIRPFCYISMTELNDHLAFTKVASRDYHAISLAEWTETASLHVKATWDSKTRLWKAKTSRVAQLLQQWLAVRCRGLSRSGGRVPCSAWSA